MAESLTGLPPIIPRAKIFGNPERSSPTISPDGKQMAFLAPDDADILQVWVMESDAEFDSAVKVTQDKKRGVRSYSWAQDSKRLLYVQDSDGDENWHVFMTDLQDKTTRDLTPYLGIQANVVKTTFESPNTLLVSMNKRNPQLHDVYKVDLDTGAMVLDTLNPGDVVGWLADENMVVRACQAAAPDGGFIIRVRNDASAEWRELLRVTHEDSDTHIVSFSKCGQFLYLVSSVGSNTAGFVKWDLQTNEQETIFADDDCDVRSVLLDHEQKAPMAVCSGRLRMEWIAIQDHMKAKLEALTSIADGDPVVVSRDHADKHWIVALTSDQSPVRYYVFDPDSGESRLLLTSRPDLEELALAKMLGVEIPASDGLRLPSYLSLPPNVEHKNLPLVLVVHGGPWVRDDWGFNGEAQWLANRGYAVLQVNYRGSTGFGKNFVNAGDREWGARMHDDLLDAVNWAVEQGYADRDRVAIYGGSYGGYAALVGASFTPDFFTCAVDIVGPSSLETLINSFPPYWEPLKKMFEKRVGPADDVEFLRSRSPLFKADQIKIPLLIAQGANDPRVKQAESEQIVDAVRNNGHDVEYMLFEDEGHGFAVPQNRLKFYAAAESFLAKHLGGRCEEAAAE